MDGKMRYLDVDELMNQYGRSIPDDMTITDMIRRDNNVTSRQNQSDSIDGAGGY